MTIYTPSYDICSIIEADSSFSWEYGTDMFISRLPDLPNEAVAIIDTFGGNDLPSILTEIHVVTFQILVRGKNPSDYLSSYSDAVNIYQLLNGHQAVSVNSAKYISINGMSNIGLLMFDERDRPIWTMNFIARRSIS